MNKQFRAHLVGGIVGFTGTVALARILAADPMTTTTWLLVGGTLCAVAALAALVYVILSNRHDD